MLQGMFRRRFRGAGRRRRSCRVCWSTSNSPGPIRCPLVLISQISRSGGTWLSQLLDHHPQVWAHPLEFRFGQSRKSDWPDLPSISDAEDAWELLRYAKAEETFGSGTYAKGNDDTHPMLFEADTQHALFFRLAEISKPTTDREWFDLYFTSFFSVWLDYQRRYGPKRYVAGFASMLALEPQSMARFRQVYPDGWLISILREPFGWYASVKKRAEKDEKTKRSAKKRLYGGFDQVEAAYLDNIKSIHANRTLFGDRYIELDYETLVADTETTVRALAACLGLDWHPTLTRQTFNGMSIRPNTSFTGGRKSVLSEEDVARIGDGPMMAAYRTYSPEFSAPPMLSVERFLHETSGLSDIFVEDIAVLRPSTLCCMLPRWFGQNAVSPRTSSARAAHTSSLPLPGYGRGACR